MRIHFNNGISVVLTLEKMIVSLFPEDNHFAFGSVMLPINHLYVDGDIVWTSSGGVTITPMLRQGYRNYIKVLGVTNNNYTIKGFN